MSRSSKVRLVVEIDGPSHQGREPLDAQRDRALNALGWRVLRIEERRVFESLEAVVVEIARAATT